jgi:hypothetical protein
MENNGTAPTAPSPQTYIIKDPKDLENINDEEEIKRQDGMKLVNLYNENVKLKQNIYDCISTKCMEKIFKINYETSHYIFTDDLCNQLKTKIQNDEIENSFTFLPCIQHNKDVDLVQDISGNSSILYLYRDYKPYEISMDFSDTSNLSVVELQNKIKNDILNIHDKLIESREITSWFCYKSPYVSKLTNLCKETPENIFNFLPTLNTSEDNPIQIYKSDYAYYYVFSFDFVGFTAHRHFVDSKPKV